MNQLIKTIDDVRMLTLTMRASNEPLKDQLKTLRESWNKFRRQKQIKAKIKGGLCVMEITHNAKTDRWHPHLHIVFEGDYLDQKKASECWAKAAAGSTIVDIRRIPSRMAAVNYLAKYVSKTSIFPVRDIGRLDEWVTAVKGLREFSTFGSLHNRIKKEIREKKELQHWMYLGQLVECGAQDHPGCMAAYSRILKLPRKTGDLEVDEVLLGRHLAAYEYANEQYRDFLGVPDRAHGRKRKIIEPDLFDGQPAVLTMSNDENVKNRLRQVGILI